MGYVVLILVLICLAIILGVGLAVSFYIWLPALALTILVLGIDLLLRTAALQNVRVLTKLGSITHSQQSVFAFLPEGKRIERYWNETTVYVEFVIAYLVLIWFGAQIASSVNGAPLGHSQGETLFIDFLLLIPVGAVYWLGPFIYGEGSRIIDKELSKLRVQDVLMRSGFGDAVQAINRLAEYDQHWKSNHCESAVLSLNLLLREGPLKAIGEPISLSVAAQRFAEGIDGLGAALKQMQEPLASAQNSVNRLLSIEKYWESKMGKNLDSRLKTIASALKQDLPSNPSQVTDELNKISDNASKVSDALSELMLLHQHLVTEANKLTDSVVSARDRVSGDSLNKILDELQKPRVTALISKGELEQARAHLFQVNVQIENLAGYVSAPPDHIGSTRKVESKPTGSQKLADAWETLNLPPSTSRDIAHDMFRLLSKVLHPDRNPNDAEKYKRITEAWEIIKKHFEEQDVESSL